MAFWQASSRMGHGYPGVWLVRRLLGGVYSLCYQAKNGDGAHEEDGIVKGLSRHISLLIICPGLDEQAAQIGEICHCG
jgi:hypothetical protein